MTQLFGTNGIRGIVNKEMTCELALGLGKAWGSYLTSKKKKPTIVIGTDARLSKDMLKQSIAAGFLSVGCDITDIGLVPTPCLQYFVKTKSYDSGVMITASHNPPAFNGIKGIAADGTEFSKETEEAIEQRYFKKNYQTVSWDTVGKYSHDSSAISHYIKGILSCVDSERIKKQSFHVILDCGSGAGSMVTPKLLKQVGCHLTELYCKPDGRFPGHDSEPTPENLTELIQMVKKQKADLGVAQDGDADRAIFIDEHGTYVWGDQMLSLLAEDITEQHKGGIVVTPVTTSSSLKQVVERNNGEVVFTQVGSPVVARVMKEKQAIFGGEENGGLIFPDMQYCRDSATTIVKLLELLSRKKQTLSQLLKDIPTYFLVKKKISCPPNLKGIVMNQLTERSRSESNIERIDTTDGIKLYFSNTWVLIRPSGTESIIRIFAESNSSVEAEHLASHYESAVNTFIEECSQK